MATKDNLPYGLHIPKKGKTWVYRFTINGEQHSRSTRRTKPAEAIKVAGAAYARAMGEVPTITREKRKPDMTLDAAFDRYYEEKAVHLKSANDLLSILARLAEKLGPDVMLGHLTFNDLANYQTERRKEGVSNRTINYEIPETLRPVVKRANLWGIDTGDLGRFTSEEWKALKLPIPKHRTRSATREEQARLFKALRKDYRRIIRFALMTGLRRAALLLRKDQIDWDAGILTYAKKSKFTDDKGILPLTPRMLRLLRHEASKTDATCEYVFTFICEQPTVATDPAKRRVVGQRYPITYENLSNQMQRAVKDANLKDWRLMHDLRHTAATETLRSAKNIAGLQQMLGHSNISQTIKYAHLLSDDVLEMMKTRERGV